jgi:hypothetical protein
MSSSLRALERAGGELRDPERQRALRHRSRQNREGLGEAVRVDE